MSRKIPVRAAENLLRQTTQLKGQMSGFRGSAREIMRSLDKALPNAEVEAMVTPEANVLGTLECLLAEDFEPALRKLSELESLLR